MEPWIWRTWPWDRRSGCTSCLSPSCVRQSPKPRHFWCFGRELPKSSACTPYFWFHSVTIVDVAENVALTLARRTSKDRRGQTWTRIVSRVRIPPDPERQLKYKDKLRNRGECPVWRRLVVRLKAGVGNPRNTVILLAPSRRQSWLRASGARACRPRRSRGRRASLPRSRGRRGSPRQPR